MKYKRVPKIVPVDINNNGIYRYFVVDVSTGEVLDDACGYGYKTKEKASLGYLYVRNKIHK